MPGMVAKVLGWLFLAVLLAGAGIVVYASFVSIVRFIYRAVTRRV